LALALVRRAGVLVELVAVSSGFVAVDSLGVTPVGAGLCAGRVGMDGTPVGAVGC
jgi:hypothetical protein